MRVYPIQNCRPALRRLFTLVIAALGLAVGTLPSFGAGLESIFFAEFGANRISRMNGDGTGVTTVVSQGGPDEVAVDPIGRKIYFTLFNSSTVARANFDGSNLETLAINQGGASGIALDLANGHVYWAGFGGFVRRANLDGSSQVTLFTGGNNPDGLALDLANGHIYFTNRNAPFITRINLDGSNITSIATAFSGLTGIALNPAAGKIFFGTINSPSLVSVNYDGSGIAPFIPSGGSVGGVEVDLENGHIYFAGNNQTTLFRADLDGSDVIPVAVGRQNLLGIGLLPRVNRTVATLNAAAPGLPGTTFRSFTQPMVNRTGKVAFGAALAGSGITTVNDLSLWSTLGDGSVKLVAQEGGATGVPGVVFKILGAPHIADGHLVFRAKLAGSVTTATDDAICVWNGTALSILAREGDPSPEGGTWGTPGLPSVNDAGEVLFSATYRTPAGTGNGLFRTAAGAGAITPVALRNGTVELDGEELAVASFTHRPAATGERLISNNGFVGTVLKLADGRTIIAVLVD